jgi:hypothetical protein
LVTIDQTQGNLIARLCDVHPDGTSTLIARGVLNLCQRESQGTPQPMPPGQPVEIKLKIDETCYRVRPGHQLRLALSTTYFPMVIPSPKPVVLSLSNAAITLPLANGSAEIDIPEPENPNPLPKYAQIEPGERRRSVEHDLTHRRTRYHIVDDGGLNEHPRNGMQSRDTRDEVWTIDHDDPTSITGKISFTAQRKRGVWSTRTEAEVNFSATETTYEVTANLKAWDGETEFAQRNWQFSVPRDHM